MSSCKKAILIAVVGGSGAGKSWFAERLCRMFGSSACTFGLDNFYNDYRNLFPAQLASLNFDVPAAIDWHGVRTVLGDCRAGRTTRIPQYDFATHRAIGRITLRPTPLVVVEGLWLLSRPSIRRLFDLTIYLDCPDEIRFVRRLHRDVSERGRTQESVRDQFSRDVAPMHARHVEPQGALADLVLAQPYTPGDIRLLSKRLGELIGTPPRIPMQPGPFETWLELLLAPGDQADLKAAG